MKLLVVESPAKAKTIEKYLGGEYKVKASVGHIRDLPKSNKNAVDVAGGFVPHYEIVKGKEAVVAELKKLAAKASEVLLATDPDREGEAIAWHIAEAAKLKKPRRVVFHEITKEAISEALKHPRDINQNLKTAQEARRVLDRLFGYDLSGLIWQKLRYGLSAGRVQSPALRLLVEREREIKKFVPENFWVIGAELATASGQLIKFTCSEEPKTQEAADKIVTFGQAGAWQIKTVESSEAHRAPRAPFTTSTLQQAASSRLHLSPSQTMRLAQKLYEAGLITYMRTDSTTLSEQARAEMAKLIKKDYGEKYYEGRRYQTKSKLAQEAHEAIRPTNVHRQSDKNTAEEKLYQLIWSRSVASQMSAAALRKTKITAATDNPELPPFNTTGSIITFEGWLRADPAARGEENELPQVTAGQTLTLQEIEALAKQTEPPHRYSEAALVKELEKRGIGRPSTYAPIIKTLLDRQYALRENRSLRPTETGEVVSEFLETHFGNYISDDFTSQMENQLDHVALGELGYEKMLKDFYTPFKKSVAGKKDLPKLTHLGPAPAGMLCPQCQAEMIAKLGKSGKFFSCIRWPECSGARTSEGEEMKGPEATGEPCPECGSPLVTRTGRYGQFIACSTYPKCKYVKNDEEQEKKNDTGVECPKCHKGTMREKRGRYGVFYGCSNYPECKNIIKTRPTGRLCPTCGALMMEGTKTIPERCSSKICPNHNPHKLEGAKKAK